MTDTSIADTSLFTGRYCPITRTASAMELQRYAPSQRYAPRAPKPNAIDTTNTAAKSESPE